MAKKRAARKLAHQGGPRIATAQFVRRLNWFVGLYKTPDLRFYVHEDVLDKFGIMDAVKNGHASRD